MDIVYLSGYDFRGFVRFRPQHVMTRLARRHRVLYVEPTRARKWRRPWRWGRLTPESETLAVLEPPVLPGLQWSGLIRRFNEALVRWCIRSAMRRLGFGLPITVVGTPFATPIAGSLGECLIVYDCNDDWTSIPRLPSDYLKRQEERLTRRADLVFATSRALCDRLAQLNSRTRLLPSGADIEHFASSKGRVPEELRDVPRPVIGSIGSINATKDDLELLDAIASKRPKWSFVFIGPVMPDVDLRRYPALERRAHFLGARPYESLPAYVQAMDVCTVAYKRNTFTASANPTKVFEFLGAGKPVVATVLEDLTELKPLVALAETSDDFIVAIDAALMNAQDAPRERARIRERIERSRERSWDSIVNSFETHITHELRGKGHVPHRPVHHLV